MRNKRLEQELIKLSQEIKQDNVTPLIIEYVDVYTTCLNFSKCDKVAASDYALSYLRNKYRKVEQHKPDYIFDDVNVINCNIQRL